MPVLQQAIHIEKFVPSPILQPFIKSYMIIESGHGMDNSVLPATSLTMALRLKGQVYHMDDSLQLFPAAMISGIRKSAFEVKYLRDTANLLITFREGGASAFFETPLHELADKPVSLFDLIPALDVMELEERLHHAVNNKEKIIVLERWFTGRLKHNSPNLIIQYAISEIMEAKGDVRIKRLIAELPISRDPFEKKFRSIVGTTPKQFASIVRLRNLIENYSHPTTLTDAAHRAGYFDQAHFIKDFQAFTGKTPSAFFATPYRW